MNRMWFLHSDCHACEACLTSCYIVPCVTFLDYNNSYIFGFFAKKSKSTIFLDINSRHCLVLIRKKSSYVNFILPYSEFFHCKGNSGRICSREISSDLKLYDFKAIAVSQL